MNTLLVLPPVVETETDQRNRAGRATSIDARAEQLFYEAHGSESAVSFYRVLKVLERYCSIVISRGIVCPLRATRSCAFTLAARPRVVRQQVE